MTGPGSREERSPEWERGTSGTYGGTKDSAEQAKAWHDEQRRFGSDDTMTETRTSDEEPIDMVDAEAQFLDVTDSAALDGEDTEHAGDADADDAPGDGGFEVRSGAEDDPWPPTGDEAGDSDDAALPGDEVGGPSPMLIDTAFEGVDITSLDTGSQAGPRTVFLRSTDALALVIRIGASQAIVDSGRRYDADYVIVRHSDNRVVRHLRQANAAFSHGRFFWISMGNTWNAAAYDTPERWGLGTGIYTFQATLQVIGTDAFATSGDHLFRVR